MNRVLHGLTAGLAAVCISMPTTSYFRGSGSKTNDALATNPSGISGDIRFSA